MKVVIIEDEYPAADHIKTLLSKADPDIEILDVLDSVSTASTWFDANPLPDLVLSDIQLSDGLSFEIFERNSLRCPIIFTTAYDEYAIKAFKPKTVNIPVDPKAVIASGTVQEESAGRIISPTAISVPSARPRPRLRHFPP